MSVTSRKKRPLDRAEATRDARLIVIATEGSITERIYFNAFGNSRVKIHVLPSEEGKSAPGHVCSNLAHFQSEYQLDPTDELWMVIDKDRWPEAKLHELKATCKDVGFQFTLSNPCFEIWLAYHLDQPLPSSITATELTRHLKANAGGFSKTRYDAKFFADRVASAISLAKEDDKDPNSPWPTPHGSRVYRIMASVLR